MTTVTTTRPVNGDSEFNLLMRSSLKSQDVWEELVSTPHGINQASHWLKTTVHSIDRQLAYWQDQAEIHRLNEYQADARTRLVELHEWRTRARYLKALCEKRLIDLEELRLADENRAALVESLLVRLATAVVDHESARIDDEGLHSVLDSIQLPGEDAPSLREYLGRETAAE
ncbi:hypothetical protein [Streptomyces sp. NPDC052042]|uniref:hypothetical protein n=1 Tax=Streptomyces sp. NPDC052042 TaxID=3365683 RepID=UPI0037D22A80